MIYLSYLFLIALLHSVYRLEKLDIVFVYKGKSNKIAITLRAT